MRYPFTGRPALVTGAGSGIGRAAALAFASSGAPVVALDTDDGAVADIRREIEANGGTVLGITVDVTDRPAVDAAVGRAVTTFGGIDFAFNNAGIRMNRVDVQELELTEWQRVLDVNLTGIFHCLQAVSRMMLRAKRGAIINTASINGSICTPGSAHYTASKHAIVGLTKSAALDLAPHGIRVNAVAPGVIVTPMLIKLMGGLDAATARYGPSHALGRLGTPEEVAAAVLWLASDEASFVTGHTLAVDGGYLIR